MKEAEEYRERDEETKEREREKGGQKVAVEEEEAAAGNSIQPVGSLRFSLERDIPDSRRRAWIILHGPLLTRAPLKNRANRPPPNRNQISICRWATGISATSLRLLLSEERQRGALSARRRGSADDELLTSDGTFLTDRGSRRKRKRGRNLADYRPRYVKNVVYLHAGLLPRGVTVYVLTGGGALVGYGSGV